ncbi:hypothetical protein C8Q74DRAFT_1188908 [Fomes fomentarius]|nr:hypothetical protein C8Q74DRAFT_1188908 [Fomes fomentarius]
MASLITVASLASRNLHGPVRIARVNALTLARAPDFLSSIKSLFPPASPQTPTHLWPVIAAVSFSASNLPEAVPLVFKQALDDLVRTQQTAGQTDHDEQLVLARKIREAVLQSGFLSGIPRAINSLVALHKVMPEHLRESKPLRDTKKTPEECDRRGEELFRNIYRDSTQNVQTLLNAAYPDLGWYCTTVGYGMTYGGTSVLAPLEVIYLMVTALIAVDSPRQIAWHLANARRAGAPLAEIRAVRHAALEVARRAGVVWREGVPEVELELELEENEGENATGDEDEDEAQELEDGAKGKEGEIEKEG